MRCIVKTIKIGKSVLVGIAAFASFAAAGNSNAIISNSDDTTRLIIQNLVLSKEDIANEIRNTEPDELQQDIDNYPIRSALLTPGEIETRVVDIQLMHPVFLIGDDERSATWLKRYQEKLKLLHAQGFVMNIESANAMKTLQEKFPQLPMLAIPGDAVAQWLGLSHYPALISNHLIEQ